MNRLAHQRKVVAVYDKLENTQMHDEDRELARKHMQSADNVCAAIFNAYSWLGSIAVRFRAYYKGRARELTRPIR